MNVLQVIALILESAPELVVDIEKLIAEFKTNQANTTPEASLAAKIARDTQSLADQLKKH